MHSAYFGFKVSFARLSTKEIYDRVVHDHKDRLKIEDKQSFVACFFVKQSCDCHLLPSHEMFRQLTGTTYEVLPTRVVYGPACKEVDGG